MPGGSTDDGPDSIDLAGDSADDVLDPCPKCRRAVYEGTERCPHCGHYLSDEDDDTPRTNPTWVIVTAAVCLIVFVWLAAR